MELTEEQIKKQTTEGFLPVAIKDRTLGGLSLFSIWIACNLVVTTVLTGMQMIPEISMGTALIIFLAGSIAGVIPLVLVGIIGTKTGLATMVAGRATFGIKGSLIPTVVNVTLLIAWSWAQAGLGGYALNYLSAHTIGFNNSYFFIALTEIIVVTIALYAIKGVALYEKFAMVLIIGFMSVAAFKIFDMFSFDAIMGVQVNNTTGLSEIAAFEIVVAMALSWVPMAADYSRNCKTVKGCILGSSLGYTIGTTIAMSCGALLVGALAVKGSELVYEPAQAFGEIGLGIPGAIAIFFSVLAANVMCVYSSTMSILNFSSKLKFRSTAFAVGIICLLGAMFSGILDVFLDFLALVGVLFMPMFAIIIADFYVIQKQNYNIDAIIAPEKDPQYIYTNGFNMAAIGVYAISAVFAYVLTAFYQIPIGATIPSFFVAFILYIVAAKCMKIVYPQLCRRRTSDKLKEYA